MKRIASLLIVLALSACNISTMTKIDLQTEVIQIPYPEEGPATVALEVGPSREISVRGNAEMLIEGEIVYNVREWVPEVAQEGGHVAVSQDQNISGIPPRDAKNRWDLRLGSGMPFELEIKGGVGEGEWALGGLPLAALTFEAGAGKNDIAFERPNPEVMQQMQIDVGAGEVNLRDVLNANAESIWVDGGAGKITLAFTGEALNQSTNVRINAGVGNIEIVVDEAVPARVEVSGGIGKTEARGGFTGQTDGYETPAYDDAEGPRLEIDIDLGVGSVTLDTR